MQVDEKGINRSVIPLFCTTHHFTFLQIRTITSASNNPQTQTETSNTHVNGDMGECNEGNGVQTIWDTHKNSTAC